MLSSAATSRAGIVHASQGRSRRGASLGVPHLCGLGTRVACHVTLCGVLWALSSPMALQPSRPAKRSGPCGHCGKVESSQWRVGPLYAPTLCNAWCVPVGALQGGATRAVWTCPPPSRPLAHRLTAALTAATRSHALALHPTSGVCWGRKKKLPTLGGRSPSVSGSAEPAVEPTVPAPSAPRPRLGGHKPAAAASVNELAAVLLALGGSEAENCGNTPFHSVAPPSVPPRRRSTTARADRCVDPSALGSRRGAQAWSVCLALWAWSGARTTRRDTRCPPVCARPKRT